MRRCKIERHFREALGTKPLAADRLIRLERAKHLLRNFERFATRILAQAGHCDLPHLIRPFRAADEMTPKGFRRTRRAVAPAYEAPENARWVGAGGVRIVLES